jgi:hypothetical protein
MPKSDLAIGPQQDISANFTYCGLFHGVPKAFPDEDPNSLHGVDWVIYTGCEGWDDKMKIYANFHLRGKKNAELETLAATLSYPG